MIESLLPAAGTVFAALVAATATWLVARTTKRSNHELDAAEWERRYRAAAELHMRWDFDIRSRVLSLSREVDMLRVRLGEEPSEREPIDQPPPLFPTIGGN